MTPTETIERASLAELLEQYPFARAFFEGNGLTLPDALEISAEAFFREAQAAAEEDESAPVDAATLSRELAEYIEQMLAFLVDDRSVVRELTILPGTDKDGETEGFAEVKLRKGETVCIVGPTGSGKSRLLADIEWVAQGDTPTGRKILLNGEVPDRKWRFSPTHKLVAQLSQNMNFVMDLSVAEFLALHAESRMVRDADAVVARILAAANDLAGEPFLPTTPVTSLSGGQSRALMIADTAILSSSPIVLIDEIENAGIDRRRALDLLLSEDKIVLMATHDPVLALMGERRLVIRNGGIAQVIETTDDERTILAELDVMDRRTQSLRQQLRRGETLR